jgi:hypothetical protein
LLDDGLLYVAVAPDGQGHARPVEDTLTLSPNLVTTETGMPLFPVFTDEERLGRFAANLNWAPDGELSYCSLSVRGALDVGLQLFHDGHCHAMVVDPSDEYELLLQPREVASLRQGQPIPLVGYVRELPLSNDDVAVVSDFDASDALKSSLARCLEDFPEIVGHRLEQTLNRERDVDPHPTLTLSTSADSIHDEAELQRRLREIFEGALPEPGYIDVVFESPRGAQ